MTLTNNTIKLAGVATDPLLDLNTYPSLDLQFATTKTLNDEVSGTPLVDHQRRMDGANASPGTFVNSSGLIETSKVNLLKYSEQFDNVAWVKGALSVTPDQVTAPDGSTTADKISWADTFTSSGNIYQSNTDRGTATNPIVEYTLTGAGTANVVVALAAGSDYGIDPVGNGWYRCWLYDSTAGQTLSVYAKAGEFDQTRLQFYTTNRYIYVRDSVATQGDGTSGIYLWGAQLEEGSTVSPYIKTTDYPSAAPRFDHNPSTNASLGFLIEESRENLLTYSQEFDNAAWIGSATPNTEIAPDGTLTADTFSFTTQYSAIYFNNLNLITTPGTVVTISCYIKNIDGNSQLSLRGSVSGGIYTQPIDITSEWQRYTATFTHNGTNNLGFNLQDRNVSGQGSIYIWGAQLEVGSFPTSYIPTSGTTATRAADTASITGSNFTSFYNQSAGTLFSDCVFRGSDGNAGLISLYQSTLPNNNRISFRSQALFCYNDNIIQFGFVPNLAANQQAKVALGMGSDAALAKNGTIIDSDGTVSLPQTLNAAKVGDIESGGYRMNGHISRLTYYPYRLADATLQIITS